MKNGSQATRTWPRASRTQRRDRIPVEATNVSQRERALLPDPRWVTEDDADAIMAARRRRETPVPLEQALKRLWKTASGELASARRPTMNR
jgi:hypothetical protein